MRPDPYAWSLDAEAFVLVPLLALAYAAMLRVHPALPWRRACFAAGLALVLVAFVTPLQQLARHYLLLAHLLQNVVLAEWAPLLCVAGIPAAAAAARARARAWRIATHPLVALPLWLATDFAWHPWWLLHLEHLSYLVPGVLLWGRVLPDAPQARGAGARAGYLFAAFALASPLGLLLALIPDSIYTFYERAPRLWGLSPLTDQQIAGVTMAVEQAIVLFLLFAAFVLRFLREEEAVGVTARRG
jgi:putative membrane protein